MSAVRRLVSMRLPVEVIDQLRVLQSLPSPTGQHWGKYSMADVVADLVAMRAAELAAAEPAGVPRRGRAPGVARVTRAEGDSRRTPHGDSRR